MFAYWGLVIMKKYFKTILGTAFLLAVTSACFALDQAIVERVNARMGDVARIKNSGLAWESDNGYLVTADDLAQSDKEIVLKENDDRRLLFKQIAENKGITVQDVEKTFAERAVVATPRVSKTPSNTPVSPVVTNPLPTKPISTKPVQGRTASLPLKVLAKPMASVYTSPSKTSAKAREKVPAFNTYYVYTKDGEGDSAWYEVGEDNRGQKKIGWMSGADVVEWKQNLCVQFTHPDGRDPVLFFHERTPLEEMLSSSDSDRRAKAKQLYATVNSGEILPTSFPVKSMEPRRGVSDKELAFCPIVDFKEVEVGGREARLLKLAAVSRRRGASLLTDTKSRTILTTGTDYGKSGDAKIDLVFVMDLTRSMGPFADRTKEMMVQVAKKIGANQQVNDAIRFGFWGFRDNTEKVPGLEFVTRNYTPQLQRASEFQATLAQVKETKVDSLDFCEDVFAGIADAVENTAWREGAMRYLVLVGDAPGRNPGESDLDLCGKGFQKIEGTARGMDAETLRGLANSKSVYVTSIYLRASKWDAYAENGERQFRILARNPNGENFVAVVGGEGKYGKIADALGNQIVALTGKAKDQTLNPSDLVSKSLPNVPVSDDSSATDAGMQLANNMFRGAVVQSLSRKGEPLAPSDITAWALDKDFTDPSRPSLDVQIFLTKNQLDSLRRVMDQVLNAGIRQQVSGDEFFSNLQAVVATAANAPEQIDRAANLAKTGLLPDFLKDLPYRSRLMAMSNDSWGALSADAQDRLLKGVESKINYYRKIHDDPSKWQALNEGDDADNHVAPIPLDQLP